jgi:phage N-6-adenine-methyltransferase
MSMERQNAEEFTDGIGHIGIGMYKQIAWAHKNGVPQALGYNDTRQWVQERIGGYFKYDADTRRGLVEDLRNDGHSNRDIGQILGVAEVTARRDGASNDAPPEENDNDSNEDESDGASNDAPHVRGTFGTGENEWYTPQQYIEAARAVLGVIDLDPASSEIAQKTVKATRFFTEEANGLDQEWKGRVWLNPPYAQPHIENFADKMIAQLKCGNVIEAIMLTHNYTDTAWFQKLALYASSICFTKGRVRFISPKNELASPTQGQTFFFFGEKPGHFFEVFRPFGFIARPVR